MFRPRFSCSQWGGGGHIEGWSFPGAEVQVAVMPKGQEGVLRPTRVRLKANTGRG